MSDLSSQEQLRNDYWSEQAKNGWGSKGPDPFVTDFFREHMQELDTRERRIVVDIGCGTGDNVIFFAQNGCEVIGIEPAPLMRERALQAVVAAGQQAKIIDGESSSLPFKDTSVDLVLSLGVSHHGMWKSAQRDVAEIARVLKPGGYTLFRVRSVHDTHIAHEQIEDVGFTARDIEGIKKGIIQHYFTEEELRQLGKDSGLEIVGNPSERVQQFGPRQRVRWRIVYRKALTT